MAQRKQQLEQVKLKHAVLKETMGFTENKKLHLVYDTLKIEKDLEIDTTQILNYDNRIEYQELQTQQRLSQYNVLYQKLSFAPAVSLFANYNILYYNDQLSDLYNNSFPNSLAGIQLSLPLFQGTKRLQNIRLAQLQLNRMDWDKIALEKQMNSEYVQSLGAYKGFLNEWKLQKENVEMAKDVYQVVMLQYNSGIKTFLDVTVAETDLRTAELNYLNALYQVLSSTLDVKKAIGIVNISP